MSDEFPRRQFFKKFLQHVGETSTNTLRSFHLEDVVENSDDSLDKKRPMRPYTSEVLAVPTKKPRKET